LLLNEGENAIVWARLFCRRLAPNAVRLQLNALVQNLAALRRTLTLPEAVSHWSLNTARRRLVGINAWFRRRGCFIRPQMAEIVVTCDLFQEICEAIATLSKLLPTRYGVDSMVCRARRQQGGVLCCRSRSRYARRNRLHFAALFGEQQ